MGGTGLGTFLPITPRQAIEGVVVVMFAGVGSGLSDGLSGRVRLDVLFRRRG